MMGAAGLVHHTRCCHSTPHLPAPLASPQALEGLLERQLPAVLQGLEAKPPEEAEAALTMMQGMRASVACLLDEWVAGQGGGGSVSDTKARRTGWLQGTLQTTASAALPRPSPRPALPQQPGGPAGAGEPGHGAGR